MFNNLRKKIKRQDGTVNPSSSSVPTTPRRSKSTGAGVAKTPRSSGNSKRGKSIADSVEQDTPSKKQKINIDDDEDEGDGTDFALSAVGGSDEDVDIYAQHNQRIKAEIIDDDDI